ncbi:hypothetical protein P152DRAFT_214876 [Eremomyces bilateralis CBS 781.70]|uniref:Uncharacterized protein n=1 Tax=Eremomyces bilateralis CBS 781.70 TaxID=1392243 RepID=A0A6G1FRY9_9PEZI|nr:uncharacterized protein P152DRAFT_214876 [Eremomyces bilateralis CBS 781.70]KAF1808615.1 hypothetical protein P152DRAFT_214876 [Eremomyces bilateralis CBS 781.70]
MGSWFGNLGLAYKYCLVFGSLLLGTLVLGCIKLLFDRKKLKEHIRKQDEERANKKDDTVELNTRERDEGDLFGVRAIEAGYFGGVYQSRPTSEVNTPSRAMSPSASQNTLVAEQLSQKLREIPSSASSVRSLAINEHSRSASRDVESTTQRRQLPHLVLRPSEAELSGRINHNGSAVNMTLDVPPSPILAQHQQQNAHHSGHLSHNSPTKGNFEDLRRADGYDSTGRTKSEQRMAQVAHSREGSNLTWDDQHSSVGTSPRGGNLRNSPESTDYPSFPNGSRSPPRVHSRSLTPTGNQASDRQRM